MRSSTFIFSILIAVASAAAHASSSDSLESFVAHPTHCQRAGIDFTGSKVGYRYLELLRVSELTSSLALKDGDSC